LTRGIPLYPFLFLPLLPPPLFPLFLPSVFFFDRRNGARPGDRVCAADRAVPRERSLFPSSAFRFALPLLIALSCERRFDKNKTTFLFSFSPASIFFRSAGCGSPRTKSPYFFVALGEWSFFFFSSTWFLFRKMFFFFAYFQPFADFPSFNLFLSRPPPPPPPPPPPHPPPQVL